MKINGLKAEKKQLENQKASYQQTIKLIDKYKADKVKLEKKLNAIKELKQGSLISVRILDEIANITPNDRLWIQSFSMSQNSIKISGIALDNATIAQYMKSVNNSEYFENATLSGTTHTAVAGRSLKSFSLSFKIIEQSTEKQQP
ncbi:MAG: PilN domain-containing protein [Proteobacteria bacterium]|nr:PilN domain-containing protein [Pseudomonadota bacterium]MBU1709107.1 PilN domain-containing protein [Pseudomonadota bacterium]